MQDKYVGDIGDFGKYALLRHLAAVGRLGVVWYLVPDETWNNDGRHLRYLDLDDSTCAQYGIAPCTAEGRLRNAREFRACDPELYDALQALVVAGRRSVTAIGAVDILPGAHVFAEEPATSDGERERWLARALELTRDVEIVFLDPDNGLAARHEHRTRSLPKYAFYDEVRRFAARSQSVVLYQHFDRRPDLVSRRRESLARALDIDAAKIHGLHYRRGTARVFFVVTAPKHEPVMRERLDSFLSGPWQRHFRLV